MSDIHEGDIVTIGKGTVRYIVTFTASEGARLMTERSPRRHLGYVEFSRLHKVDDAPGVVRPDRRTDRPGGTVRSEEPSGSERNA